VEVALQSQKEVEVPELVEEEKQKLPNPLNLEIVSTRTVAVRHGQAAGNAQRIQAI
jgi:hypothetical protein